MKLLIFFLPIFFGAVLADPCEQKAKEACPKVLPKIYAEVLLKECWFLDILLKCMKREDSFCFFHYYRYYEVECGTTFMKKYILDHEITFLKDKLLTNEIQKDGNEMSGKRKQCKREKKPST